MPPPGCPSTTTSLCPPGGNPLIACVTVPVLAVTKISVRKQIVDMTGAGVTTTPANSFQIKVDCSPYDIPTTVNTNLQFSTGTNGYSAYQTVQTVPMGGTCSVVETASVTPAAILTKCNGAANVKLTTTSTPLTNPLNPVDNQVTVTNTYTCIGTPQLVVAKKFANAEVPGSGGGAFPPMTFTVSANCTPATSPVTQTVTTTSNAPVSVTFPVTLGATCTVTEPAGSMPAFPQSAIDFCALQGKVPVWKPAVINPSGGTVTISQQITNVMIKNEWKCDTALPMGQLEVIKELNTTMVAVQFPATTWTINTNCTPAGSASSLSLTTPASGGAQIVASGMVTAQVGATCAVSEVTPSNTLIPSWFKNQCIQQGGTAQWNVPQYSVNNGTPTTTAPNVSITSGVQTVKVINGWTCVPNSGGQLEVIKVLNNAPGVMFPAKSWTINTNCTPAASASQLTLTTPAFGNGQATVSGLVTAPANASCTISEVPPLPPQIPQSVISACAPNGSPQWNVPQYSVNNGPLTTTPPTVTITSGVQTVKVINGWSCVPNSPPNGQIEVIKELQTQSTVMLFPATTWTINANCNPLASSNVVTLNMAASANPLATTSGFVTAPVNANCAISEVLPPDSALPTWAKNGCTTQSGGTQSAQWNAPQYVVNGGAPSTTAPNLTVTSGVQTVKIINSWSCKPTTTQASMQVFKQVVGPTQQIPAMTFAFNANCNPALTSSSVSVTTALGTGSGGGSTAFVGPSGANCSIVETPPVPTSIPAMTAYCSAQGTNYVPVWLSAEYENTPGVWAPMPSPFVTTFGSRPVLKVRNTWGCVPPPSVQKKKPKFRINIGIPIPGIGGGKKDNPRGGDNGPPPPPRP